MADHYSRADGLGMRVLGGGRARVVGRDGDAGGAAGRGGGRGPVVGVTRTGVALGRNGEGGGAGRRSGRRWSHGETGSGIGRRPQRKGTAGAGRVSRAGVRGRLSCRRLSRWVRAWAGAVPMGTAAMGGAPDGDRSGRHGRHGVDDGRLRGRRTARTAADGSARHRVGVEAQFAGPTSAAWTTRWRSRVTCGRRWLGPSTRAAG